MGRAEGVMAIGFSWQLLILSLAVADPNASRDGVFLYAVIGFIIVAVGAFMTAWARTLSSP